MKAAARWGHPNPELTGMVRTHIHKIRLLPLEVPTISLQGCNEVGKQLLRPAAGTAHSLRVMGGGWGGDSSDSVRLMCQGRCRVIRWMTQLGLTHVAANFACQAEAL